ncbi:SGNH/GDSL hydrolase family protein [Lacticaseibacillus yichunensis]|uniref:Acyltransferase n=1 Tax=Lacticaseibacillus yichunensis TaxID=2486015 RepID=A0ABW4CJT0_9LACO|nr:acyltransferase [Lacticaseibacillus yichunensis]
MRAQQHHQNHRMIWVIIAAILIIAGVGTAFFVHQQQAVKARETSLSRASSQAASRAKASSIAESKKASSIAASSSKAKLASEMAADPLYKEYKNYGLTYEMIQGAKTLQISAVGDSVMLGSDYGLKELFPQIQLDASVSRQVSEGPALLQKLQVAGRLADVVVVGLGTNGPVDADAIKAVMDVVGTSRQVFWVTNYAPETSWMTANNQEIEKAASTYDNFTVIDWAKLVAPHKDWLTADGVHPEVNGQVWYYTLIVKTVMAKVLK